MRIAALIRESLAATWASKVASALLCVVVAAMCVAVLATVGRSAASAAEVSRRLDQAGARTLTITDPKGSGFINQANLGVVTRLSTVEYANALGAPFDVVNGATGPGGLRLPAWPLVASPGLGLDIVRGRKAEPGEAMVSAEVMSLLGMSEPVGFLTGVDDASQYPIVGAYEAGTLLGETRSGAIVNLGGTTRARQLVVRLDSTSAANATVQSILSILAPQETGDISVESPTALAATARQLDRDLVSQGRLQLLTILVIGGAFIAAVALADVLIRRRDLGRRRALGVTRADLIALVTGRCLTTAVIGAGIGCVFGQVLNVTWGYVTPWPFVLGVAVLGVLAASISAVPPALYASRLDPVAVLRLP